MSANASPELHDAALEEAPAEALLGRVLGDRYALEEVIGRGSMGTVYRARHRRLDRTMAVKVLRPALAHDADAVERFQREARAISKLDHENCVQVIDFGCEAGLEYLVMQLVTGPCLRELMGRPMPVARAVDLVAQILLGLEHAHRRGLVHRDLKPENVIVAHGQGGRDVAKLVDFGLAQLVQTPATQRRLTQAGIVFGTPLYMSPEQASGGKIDPRTDLYAAGVILFELLSGAPPFFADDPATVAAMHVTREPPPLPHGVPVGLAPVVRRLLAKRGEDRYRTAHAAASALRRSAASVPSSSGGPRMTAPYADPASVVRRAGLAPATLAPDRLPTGEPLTPTMRSFLVQPARAIVPVRARKTTSVDVTLAPAQPPADARPTADSSGAAPAGLRPARGRGLWIAPVPMPAIERRAAFARVDHALVERPIEAPPARWTRTRAGLLAVTAIAIASAIAWLAAH